MADNVIPPVSELFSELPMDKDEAQRYRLRTHIVMELRAQKQQGVRKVYSVGLHDWMLEMRTRLEEVIEEFRRAGYEVEEDSGGHLAFGQLSKIPARVRIMLESIRCQPFVLHARVCESKQCIVVLVSDEEIGQKVQRRFLGVDGYSVWVELRSQQYYGDFVAEMLSRKVERANMLRFAGQGKISATLTQYDPWEKIISDLSKLGARMNPWKDRGKGHLDPASGTFDASQFPDLADSEVKVFSIELRFEDAHYHGY